MPKVNNKYNRKSFWCQYYPESKDEQVLYLTSFKIAACFFNSKIF